MIQYAKSRKAIDRFLSSGRIGSIGHISCVDRRPRPPVPSAAEDEFAAIVAIGASQLAQICDLLGLSPETVTARVTPDSGTTCLQVFLQLDQRTVVHYFATFDDDPCGHELWVEGFGGSLKTDGNSVWWRKRGWPKFLPVRIGIFGTRSKGPDPAAPDVLVKAIADSARSREVVGIARSQ